MSSENTTSAVSVSDMFCDKLASTIDYKSQQDQKILVANMKDLVGSNMHVKRYTGKQYNHRVFVYEGDYPSRMQLLIEYEPKASGISFFRIDFNPANCDMELVQAILLSILPGGIDDLPLRAKVTRIDLSVDLTGIGIDHLLAAYPGMQVSRVYCKSGKTETLQIGSYDGARFITIYDKVAQVKHMNAKWHTKIQLPPDPTTRIEIRLRPDFGLGQLKEVDNPFEKLILNTVDAIQEQDSQLLKMFVALAQFRGLQDSLLMIDDKNQRAKFKSLIKDAPPKLVAGQNHLGKLAATRSGYVLLG